MRNSIRKMLHLQEALVKESSDADTIHSHLLANGYHSEGSAGLDAEEMGPAGESGVAQFYRHNNGDQVTAWLGHSGKFHGWSHAERDEQDGLEPLPDFESLKAHVASQR